MPDNCATLPILKIHIIVYMLLYKGIKPSLSPWCIFKSVDKNTIFSIYAIHFLQNSIQCHYIIFQLRVFTKEQNIIQQRYMTAIINVTSQTKITTLGDVHFLIILNLKHRLSYNSVFIHTGQDLYQSSPDNVYCLNMLQLYYCNDAMKYLQADGSMTQVHVTCYQCYQQIHWENP